MIKHYLLDELDKTIASVGLISSLVMTVWVTVVLRRPTYMLMGGLAFLAFAAYLIIRRSISSSTLSYLASTEGSSPLHFTLDVIFFLLFAYSILSFWLRPDPYVRPLGFFVAIALMAAVEAVDILFLPSRRGFSLFALCKIVMIGLSLEFSQLLIYPSVVGVDPWTHQMFTLKILESGHIPEGYGYSALPFMHLLIGSTSLIAGLDYKTATMLSVSVSQVLCNVLATFLLGTFLFNKKVGLLGGLLLGVANWQVTMGSSTIPNTMAAVFIPLIIYLLFKMKGEKPHVDSFLVIVFSGALILTHALTAAVMAMLLFAFWAGFRVYTSMNHGCKTSVQASIPVLFSAGMLSWWTFASGHITVLASLIEGGFRADYFLSTSARVMPQQVIQYAYTVPFSEQLFNNIGMFLFFTVSLVGCLYMVHKRFGNSHRFVMAVGGALVLFMSFFSLVAGLGIIVERWWYFSQILLALPLALVSYLFCGIARNKGGQALLLAALTFSLSFLMIMSPTANMDNSTFSPNMQVRYALTESELQAVDRMSAVWDRTIGVDGYYSELRMLSYPVKGINREIAYVNYTDCQDMLILIRTEIVTRPFLLSYVYKLDYDPRDVLMNQTFSKIYDCGSVSGFVYPKVLQFHTSLIELQR